MFSYTYVGHKHIKLLCSKVFFVTQQVSKNRCGPSPQCTKSNRQLYFEDNNHEEADTLLIHQAVLASCRNPPDAKLMFFSPDTDMLVLVIANYDILLRNTSISMVSGVVEVNPIWAALGADRAKGLPAFHAFTVADNTGRFSRIGKTIWLNTYLKTDNDVINALKKLSITKNCYPHQLGSCSNLQKSKRNYIRNLTSQTMLYPAKFGDVVQQSCIVQPRLQS